MRWHGSRFLRRPGTGAAVGFGLALGVLAALLLLRSDPALGGTGEVTGVPPGEAPAAQAATNAAPYEYRRFHHPDGTGKFYLGREIALVMGHQGADWLERPEREIEEQPAVLMRGLGLRRGDVVADIGAGTGYYTWRLAEAVGATGCVYAVDVQPEMLQILQQRMAQRDLRQVKMVLGTETDARLPTNAIDLALMVDVYHEFSHPYEMMQSLVQSLKPGGRIAWVEYRAEDPTVPIKPLHKMTQAQIRREAAVHGLVWAGTVTNLPWQHLMFFRKP